MNNHTPVKFLSSPAVYIGMRRKMPSLEPDVSHGSVSCDARMQDFGFAGQWPSLDKAHIRLPRIDSGSSRKPSCCYSVCPALRRALPLHSRRARERPLGPETPPPRREVGSSRPEPEVVIKSMGTGRLGLPGSTATSSSVNQRMVGRCQVRSAG